jgi:hypothetical protein
MKTLKLERMSKQLGNVVREQIGGGNEPQHHVKHTDLIFAMEKETPLCIAQCDKQFMVISTCSSTVTTLHEPY